VACGEPCRTGCLVDSREGFPGREPDTGRSRLEYPPRTSRPRRPLGRRRRSLAEVHEGPLPCARRKEGGLHVPTSASGAPAQPHFHPAEVREGILSCFQCGEGGRHRPAISRSRNAVGIRDTRPRREAAQTAQNRAVSKCLVDGPERAGSLWRSRHSRLRCPGAFALPLNGTRIATHAPRADTPRTPGATPATVHKGHNEPRCANCRHRQESAVHRG